MNSTSRRLVAVAALLGVLFSAGCTSYFARFSPPIKQETQIIYKEDDFEIVQTDLVGEATVWRLFGLIPLGDERLYSRALGDLYSKADSDVTGTPAQLIQWTLDETSMFWPVPPLTRKKVVFRADLVQFTK